MELASLVYTSQLFSFQKVLLLISSDIIQRKHTENTYTSYLNTRFSPMEQGLWASTLTSSSMVQGTLPFTGQSSNLVVLQEHGPSSLTLRGSILLLPNGVSSLLASQTSLWLAHTLLKNHSLKRRTHLPFKHLPEYNFRKFVPDSG